jgi:catechol-2,3-dioxygenase
MALFETESIGLGSRRPERLAEWYRKIFGAEQVYESLDAPPILFLRMPGGALLEIYQSDFEITETREKKLSGWRYLTVRVQSLSDAVQELEQHGVRLERASHHAVGGGSALMLRDPEDNLIYLVERPSQFPRSGPSAKVQG